MAFWWHVLNWILVALVLGSWTVDARGACGYPGSPAHSLIRFSTKDIEPGTVATYECEPGFELLGRDRKVCHKNGTWTPPGIPICVLNVAMGKAPMQSSTAGNRYPQRAVDGNAELNADTCTETQVEASPWWYVNLLEPFLIQLVRINFGKPCCGNRPALIVVRIGNNRPDHGANPICNNFTGFLEEGRPLFLPCYGAMHGAFVSVHLESPPGNSLSICETFVYTDQAVPIEHCPSYRDRPLGIVSTYHGKCYMFYKNNAKTFDRARRFCKENGGGTLVNETSPALQGFLSWELFRRHLSADPNPYYWMGALRDISDRRTWKWINEDGREGNDVTVSFWRGRIGQGNCSMFNGKERDWLWSDTDCSNELNYICQHGPTKCGEPERPANSIFRPQELTIGTELLYHCDKGHKLEGPQSRMCLPNGFLSHYTPKCIYLECEMPDTISNGDFQLIDGTKYYQSAVKYTCDEGFTLEGRARLNCDENSKWDGPLPVCKARGCRSPPTVVHGRYRLSNDPPIFRTTAQLECNPGYRLVGNSTLICLASGSWDGDAPSCHHDPDAPRVSTPHVDHIPSPSSPTTKRTTTTTTTSTTTTTTTTTEASAPSREPDKKISSVDEEPELGVQTEPTLFYPETSSDVQYETSTELASSSTNPKVVSTLKPTTPSPPPTPGPATIPRYNPGPSRKRQREEEAMSTTAKINMGGIIALGIFGGFVFLAAIITVIVIIVRRSRSKHARSGSTSDTVSTNDSGNPETSGLQKSYKSAWDNLRHESRQQKESLYRQEQDGSRVRVSGSQALVEEHPVTDINALRSSGRKSPTKERHPRPLSSRSRLH